MRWERRKEDFEQIITFVAQTKHVVTTFDITFMRFFVSCITLSTFVNVAALPTVGFLTVNWSCWTYVGTRSRFSRSSFLCGPPGTCDHGKNRIQTCTSAFVFFNDAKKTCSLHRFFFRCHSVDCPKLHVGKRFLHNSAILFFYRYLQISSLFNQLSTAAGRLSYLSVKNLFILFSFFFKCTHKRICTTVCSCNLNVHYFHLRNQSNEIIEKQKKIKYKFNHLYRLFLV